jgi:serine/threonine-protein kinase
VKLGPYTVEDELARGATATVFRGRAPDGREVALKLLSVDHPVARRRFSTEAEVLRRLRHPHLVSLHDAGEDAGRIYLVVDLVRGGSLQERLDRVGPLPVRDAALGVRDLARAVQHAHDAGVLHRDIKPDNVLIDDHGRFLLADFREPR